MDPRRLDGNKAKRKIRSFPMLISDQISNRKYGRHADVNRQGYEITSGSVGSVG